MTLPDTKRARNERFRPSLQGLVCSSRSLSYSLISSFTACVTVTICLFYVGFLWGPLMMQRQQREQVFSARIKFHLCRYWWRRIHYLMKVLILPKSNGNQTCCDWWLLQSHLSGCFWPFAPEFWLVVGTFKWYFVILWMQVEWWRHSEMVGTLKSFLL